MSLSLDLVVLIAGVLMYALCVNPKLQEIGRIMFAFALLALLLGSDKIIASFGVR